MSLLATTAGLVASPAVTGESYVVCEICHVGPSGIHAVGMVIGSSPCHIYKADRGCAGRLGSLSLVFSRTAGVL